MQQNAVYLFVKYIIIDLLGDLLYFPVWWYTSGFKKFVFFCIKKIKNVENSLGISIWLNNLFVPMYGQYDLQGRIISFFARLFQFIVRLIGFGVFFILILLLPIIWLVFPMFIIYQIVLIAPSVISVK